MVTPKGHDVEKGVLNAGAKGFDPTCNQRTTIHEDESNILKTVGGQAQSRRQGKSDDAGCRDAHDKTDRLCTHKNITVQPYQNKETYDVMHTNNSLLPGNMHQEMVKG